MEYPENFERHLPCISEAAANIAYQDQPDATQGEIKMAANNVADLICVLKQMDEEKKAKEDV
jgi:hypothetical protein